jgi:hypothetical protein
MAAGPPADTAAGSAGNAADGTTELPSLLAVTDSPTSAAFAGIWILEPQWGQMPRFPAKNALTFNFFPQLSQWNLIPIALSSHFLNEPPDHISPAQQRPEKPEGQPATWDRCPGKRPTFIIRSSHFL